ncbi:MAG: beta-ketoacyl-[acyl-carrier-protein] synthase family protein, partial [Burkholderiales bacterium]|nr:beta-ketoacyl-[acyl-carrier-protein] synthase family protein [Burkholderiales bacterium]
MHRVCITGYGVASPLGNEFESFDAGLFGGRPALEVYAFELPGNDPFRVPVARCRFDEAALRTPSRLPPDRGTALALLCAESAAAAAGWSADACDPLRLGLYWGSGMGGAATFDATSRGVYQDARRIRPTAVVTTMPNAPLAELALRFGARGAAIGYACASAAVAIGEALRAIREGRLDAALVGGSDALLSPGVVAAWQAMRVLAPAGVDPTHACRPFA